MKRGSHSDPGCRKPDTPNSQEIHGILQVALRSAYQAEQEERDIDKDRVRQTHMVKERGRERDTKDD